MINAGMLPMPGGTHLHPSCVPTCLAGAPSLVSPPESFVLRASHARATWRCSLPCAHQYSTVNLYLHQLVHIINFIFTFIMEFIFNIFRNTLNILLTYYDLLRVLFPGSLLIYYGWSCIISSVISSNSGALWSRSHRCVASKSACFCGPTISTHLSSSSFCSVSSTVHPS